MQTKNQIPIAKNAVFDWTNSRKIFPIVESPKSNSLSQTTPLSRTNDT